MKNSEVIKEKELQEVMVFRLCDSDAVASYTLEDAINFYKQSTGVNDDELYSYEDMETLSLEDEIWNDEEKTKKKKLKDVIREEWNGKPFIAASWDY